MEPGGGGDHHNNTPDSVVVDPASGRGAYRYSSFPRYGHREGEAAEAEADDDTQSLESTPQGWRKGASESGSSPPPLGPSPVRRVVVTPIANLKNLLERDLSKERHELLKDQRLFRNRARKHFIETNKRRRALEEKWKEDEEKEQKLREQILLQRKLKNQEATEKFQRGHLPSAQRKRVGVQRKRELRLDEAFQKIQVTGIHLSPSKVIGRAADSAFSATRNDPFHWKQISVKAGCDRIVQESSKAKLDSDQLPSHQNLEEMQQQMHEQHFSSVQDFHQEVNEIIHPESVCSVDSLETGEPNESCGSPAEASLSAQLDSSAHNSQGLQTRNESFPDENDMRFSKSQHVNNWLINLNTSDIQTTSPFRDILVKYNVVPFNEETSNSDQKSSVPSISEGREADDNRTLDDNLTFVQNKRDKSFLWRRSSSEVVKTEDPFAAEAPALKLNRSWAITDPFPVGSVEEKSSQLPKNNNRTTLAQGSSQNAIISAIFPARKCSSTASSQKSSVPSMYGVREAERCASDDNVVFAQNKRDKSFLWKHPSSGVVGTEDLFATETPAPKLNKAWAITDPSPVVSVEEKSTEVPKNNRILPAQGSSQNTFISVVFPARQCNSSASYHSTFVANGVQKGKGVHVARCTENTDCITGAKVEKDDRIDVVSLCEEMSKSDIDEQAGNGEGNVCEISSSMPLGDLAASESDLVQQDNTPNGRKVVKLPKSILKKESKYESASFRAIVVNRGVRFGNQPVCSARDSVELAKMKVKEADSQKNSKKLRWFDEIDSVVGANDDEKSSEQNITELSQAQPPSAGLQIKAAPSSRNLRSAPTCILNSVFPENHQEASQTSAKFAPAEGSERESGIRNVFVSTEYHVAKQAWAAQRGEEMMPLVYSVDPKNPKNNLRKGRTKVIKRPKSAKVQSAYIAKNRKGTIIRPQSATEATKVMKTQGKIMVPHPPCKQVPSQRPDENPADKTNQSVNISKTQANVEDSYVSNGSCVASEGQNLDSNIAEDSSPSDIACCSHVATMQPSYSIFTYEPLKKTKSNTNTAQSVARCNSYTKRNMCSENRLCPDRTPTDEEITLLWQGVHRALAQKDSAAGDSQHCDPSCSNSNNGDLQPPRASVSHITIDGGNLTGSIKSGVKMNAVFSSPPITSVGFARRKLSTENIENKRKALLEQRRQITASAGRKPSSAGQNVPQATKCIPPQCAGEAVQVIGINNSDEVSDSTAQFLLAENLVNLSATESEIVTDLETVQPYRQTAVLNRAPRKGMSALSFEEHKVLQSLDRINQRLQNVHETINKIPSSTSVLQTISPLVASPSYMDIIRPRQRYRNISDDTRNLIQRRY